ncbi:sensor domain-containing protein [Mycobacterium sp. 48b]|uniref:sensor domain-containing protein n=1 Tax=Mycobacterium sp. 48b TaxID=3400426 RepID=UPI003AAC7688
MVYTGEHAVYNAAGSPALKTQSFGSLYGGADGPHLVQQTAAVFPSTEEARAFLEKSLAQWNSCAPGQVQAILGYENGADYAVGSVERQGDLITVAMAKNDGLNGPDACQQALVVRERTWLLGLAHARPPRFQRHSIRRLVFPGSAMGGT